jgi:hypothetical protein
LQVVFAGMRLLYLLGYQIGHIGGIGCNGALTMRFSRHLING